MIIFYYLLLIPIFIVNIFIIESDLKYKIIPNKYLGYLVILSIFFFIANIFLWASVNYLLLLSFVVIFLIAFLLYYFWVWSAWDAKYLLVLSLFNLHTWIIPLIWNIWVVIIVYMIWYFFYFYLYKCIFVKNFATSLYRDIKSDLEDKINVFFNKKIKWDKTKKKYMYVILKNILFFLIFFVAIRLFRIEIVDYLKTLKIFNSWNSWLWSYLVIWTWIISFYIILSYRVILLAIRKFFVKYILKYITKTVDEDRLKIINVTIWIILLFAIIMFDYYYNKTDIFNKLKLIFTIYLLIFAFVRLLFFSYKVTFQLSEQDYIDISELSKWEIIDKAHLISLFWTQSCLWYEWKNKKSWILYPKPADYFTNLENPIWEDDLKLIKQIYKITNKYQAEKYSDYKEIRSVKILKTFPFAIYIFLWFFITFVSWDNIAINILKWAFEIFKNYANQIHR